MKLPGAKQFTVASEETIAADKYDIILSEDNVLPLAVAELKIADDEWASSDHILDVDKKVREYLGIQCRGGQMKQPWVRKGQLSEKNVNIKLRYEFFCDVIPAGDFYLAIENPKTFAITLNGCEILPDENCGWWCDKSLRKLSIDSGLLKTGKNELLLECRYSEAHSGLEYIYLLGNFGVKFHGLKQTVIAQVKSLDIGDWCKQGLPFYSGMVAYKCNIQVNSNNGERLFIKLPEYRGVCAKLFINRREAGVVAWEPNELDVTDFIKTGDNELMIEVFSSRRNSHGPLFNAEKWPFWTGPGQYHEFTGRFNLVPCGLLKAPKILIKK